jgi:hypothetical protein
MSRHTIFAALAAAVLLPAGIAQKPPSATTPLATPGGMLPQGFEPAAVLFDRPADGALWAATGRYKAGFGVDGVTFVPFLGSDAARSWPLRLRLARVAAAGVDVASEPLGPPLRAGSAVEIARGGLVERWELRAGEAEQTFVFDALPAKGAIEIEVEFATDLEPRRADAGIVFAGPAGGVLHGRAVAIDARGRRAALTTELRGDRLVHRVPADFAADAVLPLVVDPVLSTFGTSAGAQDFRAPDVASEPGSGRYIVVSERWWSTTDCDVWSEFRDEAGALVPNSGAWIDVSTDDWQKPSVAANRAAARFLTAAEARPLGGTELRIHGRVRDATGTGPMLAPFVVSEGWIQPARNPDVGGDGNPIGPTRWVVVFEYGYRPDDTDIYYQIIDPDGSRYTGSRQLAASTADDRDPAISKSNGIGDRATQAWMIVFAQRRSPLSYIVKGATILPDGGSAGAPYDVGPGGAELFVPVVSSPTEPVRGQRYFLVCWQNVYSPTDHDILVSLVSNGVTLLSGNLSVMEGPTDTRMQVRPAVDCDGSRFAVAYSENVAAVGEDYDVFVTTVHAHFWSPTSLGLSEVRVPLAAGTQWEGAPALTARHLNPAEARYMVAYEDSNGGSPSSIRGAVYEGAGPGGIARLAHGCHGFPIDAYGAPLIGQRVTVVVPGPTGGITHSGILFGILRSPPLTIPMCAQPCLLGVDGPSYPATIHIDIPVDGSLVGGVAAVQGWDLLGGSCLGLSIRVSDTLVLTVR